MQTGRGLLQTNLYGARSNQVNSEKMSLSYNKAVQYNSSHALDLRRVTVTQVNPLGMDHQKSKRRANHIKNDKDYYKIV